LTEVKTVQASVCTSITIFNKHTCTRMTFLINLSTCIYNLMSTQPRQPSMRELGPSVDSGVLSSNVLVSVNG